MRKWLILASIASINALNAYAFASISTIPEKVEDYYDVSSFEVNFFVQIFFMIYLLLAPLAPWLISKSYRNTMLMSIVLMTIGAWVKYFSEGEYLRGLIGQGLIATMPPIILTSLPTMAEQWFRPSEHLLALTVGELSAFVGMATCFLVAPEISIPLNHLIQASLITVLGFSFLLIIKKDPVEQSPLKFSFLWREVKAIATKDFSHLLLILGVAGLTGISYPFLGLLGETLEDEDIGSQEASISGCLFAGVGLFGGLTVNILRSKGASSSVLVFFFATGTLLSLFFWCMFVNIILANYILGAFVGYFFFGLIPLGLQLTIEYNKDLKETIPSGLTLVVAQAFGLAFSYPIVYANDVNFHSLWMVFGLLFLIIVPFIIIVIKSNKTRTVAYKYLLVAEEFK